MIIVGNKYLFDKSIYNNVSKIYIFKKLNYIRKFSFIIFYNSYFYLKSDFLIIKEFIYIILKVKIYIII